MISRAFFPWVAGLLLLPGIVSAAVQAPEGTLGFTAMTLFDEAQVGHRGDLALLDVWEGGPAAAAGLRQGDVVVAIDGVQAAGKVAREAFKEQLHGAAGGRVHLTVLRPGEGFRKMEVDLIRSAFPQRQNPSFEPFAYTVPRTWRLENYSFPLPWAPQLPYRGVEDVLFVPDFDDRAAAGYHGLVWVFWLDGRPAIDAGTLRSLLLGYFRGLSQERGGNANFTPDLEKVAATVSPIGAPPSGAAATARPTADAYRAQVVTYNRQGELITLQAEIDAPRCPDSDHTALLIRLATRPHEDPIWKDLRAVTASFRCHRG
jgi:PDZ domain